ncbi:unnamed protein product, partial [Pylaiella littoralis]
MYEEAARTPPRDLLPSKFLPEFDSSPVELAFIKLGLDLELGSPGEISAPIAAAADKARPATKAKKPSMRSRRGASRTRTTAAMNSRGFSADSAGKGPAVADLEAPAPLAQRRTAPAAR